jgi:hypothetical protein
MKTSINIECRAMAKWLFAAGMLTVLSVSCGGDIYDNIKDFSVAEIIYPAKFDTLYGAVGFERVEIDLCTRGRIPSGQMDLGKAEKTIVEYISHNEEVSIVIDSVCSWLNLTGLDEPKLYYFKIYTANEYDDRSVPLEISLTPYTAQDLAALKLTPPAIVESTSSALIEWRSRLSSATVMNFYSYEYEYKDRNNVSHTGGDEDDLPSFFVEDLRKGETTILNMKCRIQPVLNGKLIMDTIDWETSVPVNISNEAIPALFLKSPDAGAVIIDIPAKFGWTMTEEVSDYTFKVSRNAGFPSGETFSIDVGNVGEFELDDAKANEVAVLSNIKGRDLYWTVVPTMSDVNVRTQSRLVRIMYGPGTVKYDKRGWTATASSENASNGGGVNTVIDGDTVSTGKFWHSGYTSNYNTPLPHWIILDMQLPLKVSRVDTWRRPGSYAATKTLQYYVGDNDDPDADTWVKLVEGAFPVGHPSTAGPDKITLVAEEPVTGRYLKLVMPDSFRAPGAPYAQIGEIDVY